MREPAHGATLPRMDSCSVSSDQFRFGWASVWLCGNFHRIEGQWFAPTVPRLGMKWRGFPRPGVQERRRDAGEVAEDYCAGGDRFAKARGAIDPERAGARERAGGDRAGNKGGRVQGPD